MDDLIRWRNYNTWANDRIFRKMKAVGKEKWLRPVESSFPSLYETWRHTLYWDAVWLARCWQSLSQYHEAEKMQQTAAEVLQSSELAELRKAAQQIDISWLELLKKMQDPQIIIHYTDKEGNLGHQPLYQIVQQVTNHATYHRGQAVTLLRQLGGEGISTDLIHYDRIHNG